MPRGFWAHPKCAHCQALKTQAIQRLKRFPKGATVTSLVDGVRHSYTAYPK